MTGATRRTRSLNSDQETSVTSWLGSRAQRRQRLLLERVEHVGRAVPERIVRDEPVGDVLCCSLMTRPSSSDSVAGIGMAPGIDS